MAINSLDLYCDKQLKKPQYSSTSSKTGAGNTSSCRLVKINIATEGSVCSTATRRGRSIRSDFKSPHLDESTTSIHMSSLTKKTFIQKGSKFVSSFPLAVNIYKANSDEFKTLKKTNKKAKKSVLTLPNDQAPIPQTCTVSDMNDSEYFQDEDRKKLKKRNPGPRNKKTRQKDREYEFYDRDARYCSQMNLDCSSTDILHNFNGDMKRNGNLKSVVGSKQVEEKHNPHDVWAVLRNINRFQFRPSPPMSEDSFVPTTKIKKSPKRRNRKDMRVVETCRTEEFAYISSYEVDSRSPHSFSRSSSFDRITVIDKQDELSNICKEFKKIGNSKKYTSGSRNKPQNTNKSNNKVASKPNTKGSPKTNIITPLSIEQLRYKNNCGDTLRTSEFNVGGNINSPPFHEIEIHEFSNPLYGKETNQYLSCDQERDKVVEDDIIYSGNFGSSKAGRIFKKGDIEGTSKDKQRLSTHDLTQLNGITKVILSKGQNIIPPKAEPPKRKRPSPILASHPSHAIPSLTNNTIIPKLTQTDIKRRIAKLKFPLVVLGKDQLSSTFEVMGLEPSQFDGLDNQVWPFMLDWQDNCAIKRENVSKTKKMDNSQKKKCSGEISEANKVPKFNRGLISTKQLTTTKLTNDSNRNSAKIKIDQKRVELIDGTQQKKPKAISQIKEKMLKLLYKNSSAQNNVIDTTKNNGLYNKTANKTNKVDAGTDTRTRILSLKNKELSRNLMNSPVHMNKQAPAVKQPLAKARWASDFIENVIRKIKCGVYYTHESKTINNQDHDEKNVDIKTIATNTEFDPDTKSISKITIKEKCEPVVTIPGFDNTQPSLEIKTMNSNEIAVKHCLTNIIVHFDVTVPSESVLNLRKSTSFIPLYVNESETKIFKCKASIINARLPAELCSILPKVMWNITQSNPVPALYPMHVDKSLSQLSTISEVTRCESFEPSKNSLYPHVRMLPELIILINGNYCNKMYSCQSKRKIEVKFDGLLSAKELLPRLSRNNLFECIVDPKGMLNVNPKQSLIAIQGATCNKSQNTNVALQQYPATNQSLLPAFKRFELAGFLRKMADYMNDNFSSCSRLFNIFIGKNATINLTTTNSHGLQDNLSINISRLIMHNFMKDDDMIVDTKLPAIKCFELKESLKKDIPNQASVTKTKKKSYVKLYRKCKSTSNISAERTFTSLNKITNLDEFFITLGSSKLLSGVFDSHSGHKILSSLKQMKTWISEINQTQALLVLLLVNKKDTPNLVRFRPVLLQGIAVSRITRANELDMEIEVIERENLNRLSHYEGLTYSPESVENQDNLFDELCWIAKTTASDYQLPFDESSEKLLKSLLEKRKKLNPSYLRVMARYVGLGLLKTPIKK